MDEKKESVGVWIKRSIGIVVFVAVLVVFLCWFQHDPEMAKFAAYLVGGGLLVWQVRASSKRANAADKTAKAMQKTADSTEKGNIAERFKNAIEHLGHESPSVRMGGIYALHHIAQDEKEYRERVFEILCAHIRETTTHCEYKPQAIPTLIGYRGVRQPSIEVQSILKLLFSENSIPGTYEGFCANLDYVNLEGAGLMYSNLETARFIGTNLQKVRFHSSNLQKVEFNGANLRGVYFPKAQLQEARFLDANLENSYFKKSNLQGADLGGAKNLTAGQLLSAKTLYQAKMDRELKMIIKYNKPELLEKPKTDNEPEA